jgi:hypothetical protein
MAMTQGAVYDAVNAIERRYQPYLLGTLFDSMASKEAAAATAAYLVLYNIVATVPANIQFSNRASLLTALNTEYANSLAAIPDQFEGAGIAAGTAAANAMIGARQGDDASGRHRGCRTTTPGIGSRC